MQGIQIADAKAPFIMFERRAVEDRQASIEAGRYVAKDVDFVLVTPHGSKDQIEREATDWLTNMKQQAQEGRLEQSWFTAYTRAYGEWKEGREVPLEGTPIVNWPLVSPAQVRMLQDLHILTVEVLAQGNEETIRRLGMGGRNLVQKAKDYLAQAKDGGVIVEQMSAMRATIDALQETVKQQTETIQALSANQPKPGAVSVRGQEVDIGDLIDTPATTKKL